MTENKITLVTGMPKEKRREENLNNLLGLVGYVY